RADLAEDELLAVEVGVVALRVPAEPVHRLLAGVLHGHADLHRIARGDLGVRPIGVDLDLEILARREVLRLRRRLGPVDGELAQPGRDLGELLLAGLLDELVRVAERVEALLPERELLQEIPREADGEIELEVVVDVAPAIAQRLSLVRGEVVADHLARLAGWG